MKTISRKTLFLAIAGISAAGAVGTAQAVSVAPTQLGQVLIYPYYTVKGTDASPYNTLLSVVNTTASTKAVKVRFREGKGSAEVLDFNLFLSPYDVWTAELDPSSSGGTKMFTGDTSCTIPKIPATGVEFRNGKYVGDAYKDNSLTRLREGYFEIIEMGTYASDHTIAINSKHTAAGVPKDCTAVTDSAAATGIEQPTGGLSGTVSLVQPTKGFNAATNAVALTDFSQIGQYYTTADDLPTLDAADKWSVTVTDTSTRWWGGWTTGIDAVSAALMKASVINEYVLDTATASATDWVVTFPTKWAYVSNLGGAAKAPFQSAASSSGSCDDIIMTYWSREEQQVTPSGSDFSPKPSTPGISICWEANVVSFNGKNVFGSSNTLSAAVIFQNGWARIDFKGKMTTPDAIAVQFGLNGVSTYATSATYTGLPAIGFAVQTFNPGTNAYAGTFTHSYTEKINYDQK